MKVMDFLARPHRWRWGGVGGEDCTTFTGSWVLAATGRDPCEGLRGAYATADEANAIVERFGGIEGLVGAKLQALDFMRVQQPVDGDVGIVTAMTGFCADGMIVKHIPGIKFGPLWAVMSARGPQVKALEFTGAAWRIA